MFIMTDLDTVQSALCGMIMCASFTVDTVQCALLSGMIVSVSFTMDTVSQWIQLSVLVVWYETMIVSVSLAVDTVSQWGQFSVPC